MPDPKDAHDVERRVDPIQHQIARSAVRHGELAQLPQHSPSDEGMRAQDLNRATYPVKHRCCRLRLGAQHEFDDPLEVVEGRLRIDYLRHVTGFGRAAAIPSTRSLR